MWAYTYTNKKTANEEKNEILFIFRLTFCLIYTFDAFSLLLVYEGKIWIKKE